MVGLELCWWRETRLTLEEVFRKPRVMGTFPFTTVYEVIIWPSAVVGFISAILNIIGVYYSLHVELEASIFGLPIGRLAKAIVTTVSNVSHPIWMIGNHKCVIQLLRSIASVENELDKKSLKWNRKHTLSYIWQYLSLHDVLRSLMNRISELDDAESFVNSYHSLVTAYRAVDKLYGLQLIVYFIMAMIDIVHSLHFTFSKNELDWLFICQVLWTCYYSFIVFLIVEKCNSSVAQQDSVTAHKARLTQHWLQIIGFGPNWRRWHATEHTLTWKATSNIWSEQLSAFLKKCCVLLLMTGPVD
ncbi:unnamed protein product [Nezara viridula]|uniref:Gustatory receptor n=1 Tax=Nezara viridula TaxID=85310 RepID=A0A9P0HLX5_NEZVI|nr:unnamed protein product [Nezara viridula]